MKARHALAGVVAAGIVAGSVAGVLAARLSTENQPPPLGALGDAGGRAEAQGEVQGGVVPADPAVEFPEALIDLEVNDLTVDQRNGAVWFEHFTYNGRNNTLYRYDPADGSLESFEVPSSIGSELFAAIAIDGRGHVIIAEGYFVLDFDPQSASYERFELPPSHHETNLLPIDGTGVTDMELDAGGRAYISRHNVAAITELDLSTGEFREMPIPESFGPVYDVALTDGALWIAHTSGLVGGPPAQTGRLDLASGRFSPVPGKTTALAAGPGGEVYGAGWGTGLVTVSAGGVAPAAAPGLDGDAAGALSSELGLEATLAVDPSSGAVWVTGRLRRGIVKFDPAGGSVRTYALPVYVSPIITGGFSARYVCKNIDCPDLWENTTAVDGMAVAPNGDVYFSDSTRARIGVIRAD